MTTTPSQAVAATVTTPIGPFTTVVIERPDAPGAAVLASGWTDSVDELTALISPRLRPGSVQPVDRIGGVTDAVIAYHDGDLGAIEGVAVEQFSGPFMMQAWKVLRTVPAGEPVSYTGFAQACGHPTAIRAAASACAHNAAALFVPCHRVLRNDGSLGGFRYGLPAKRWLLDHEAGR
jgi:methylated-DNA-[protein]-cysteine S-methyltransferase